MLQEVIEAEKKVESEKKGLFKKFKSAASKMLIGGSSQEQEKQQEKQPEKQQEKQQEKNISGLGGMFGSPLNEAGVRFVEESCGYLRNPENQVEGLFRISGSSSAIKYFRATMDAGKTPSFLPVEDAHNVASLLKMYLRELPNPIINSQSLPEPLNNLNSLDVLQTRVLNAILELMRTIDGNKELTRMDLPNLALVLGPNLIRDPSCQGSFEASADSSQILLQMSEANTQNDRNQQIDEEDDGYCIIPNASEEQQSTAEVSIEGAKEETKTDGDDSERIWAEIEKIKKELEAERQERRQLAALILPQLERTQLDLIDALSSIKVQDNTTALSMVIEENVNESTEDLVVKPKTD